ncbi:MAG TPA: hypothetical protein PKC22_05205, partial [Rhodocyclaceae bacterium]|nr:hypothetical protein [Rhodocyclaceae bacterium]
MSPLAVSVTVPAVIDEWAACVIIPASALRLNGSFVAPFSRLTLPKLRSPLVARRLKPSVSPAAEL